MDDPQKQKPPRIENAYYKRRRHSARETSQDDPQKQKPPRIENACYKRRRHSARDTSQDDPQKQVAETNSEANFNIKNNT